MEKSEVLDRIREYNKKILWNNCSSLEKEYIEQVNRKYFYSFFIKNIKMFSTVEKFLAHNHSFRYLLQEHSPKLCHYLKHLQEFTCQTSLIRMDARSQNFAYYEGRVKNAIGAFYLFYGAHLDMRELVYGGYRRLFYGIDFSCVIAQELLAGNKEVVQYCRDVLTSENNTAIITRDVISAIEQSQQQELWQLLTDVFLAARLQEGLRQAVIETVDEYQIDYFKKMLNVIAENDLLRYSSVQRGVLTWIGIGYDIVDERHVQHIFQTICDFLYNEEHRQRGLNDEDPLHIYLALYCQGVYDVDLAIKEADRLLDSSKKHIVASALVYLKQTRHFDVKSHIDFLEKYQHDPMIIGLYLDECSQYDLTQMRWNEAEVKFLFQHIEHYIAAMKEQQVITAKGFEWFSITLYKSVLALLLFDLLKVFQDEQLIDAVLPYVAKALSDQRLDLFMKQSFPLTSMNKRKAFMLKEIISSREQLSDRIVQEYEKIELSDEDMKQLETRLKTKKAYARANIIKVLSKQGKERVLQSYQRLYHSSMKSIKESAIELQKKVPEYFHIQEEHTIIKGKEEGFGLYERKKIYPFSYQSQLQFIEKGIFKKKKFLDLSFLQVWDKQQVLEYISLWNQRIIAHANDEYETHGDYRQVGNQYFYPIDYKKKSLDALPLGDVWRDYFKEDQLSEDIIFQLQYINKSYGIHFDKIVSPDIKLISIDERDVGSLQYFSHYCTIMNYYFEEMNSSITRDKAFAFLEMMNHFSKFRAYSKEDYSHQVIDYSISSLNFFQFMISCLNLGKASDEEFCKYFPVLYESYVKYHLELDDTIASRLNISPFYLSRAVSLQLLPQEALFEGILDRHYQKNDKLYFSSERDHQLFEAYSCAYFKGRGCYGKPSFELPQEHSDIYQHLRTTLDKIADTLLPMEATRLNEKTAVTDYISYLFVIRGLKYLILALHVLDNEKIKRVSHYSNINDRNTIFCEVIKHTYPIESDTPEMLEKEHFSEKRLVEVAMMAPQWMELIAKVLKWEGFKEACYYFIAHMKQYDVDQKKAEIVKYTDLDPQDLNDGAFDMEWCRSIYQQLGEKRMKMVYDSAKFLCENSFHTRARKYADACLQKEDKQVYLKQIIEKRNKDALSAYCICPIENDQDLLERYIVLQNFLKESKKFGAQRQSSEKRAVEIALMNLARNSRFQSVTRLMWMMEGEMISQYQHYLVPQKVEDVDIWIVIDDQGKNTICVKKKDKILKSIPAKIKNNEIVLEIKKVHKMWMDQYRRSLQQLETAMTERIHFSLEEIMAMMKNPIISPMLEKLVLISRHCFGFYQDGKLKGLDAFTELDDDIRIAHPFDLYQYHLWPQYQEFIFKNQIVQPFKQVFRELYLKLDDELSQSHTKRYTGYQIQPKKASSVLKSRKWNVSYENGLERVYHKENLIVNLYADADWFSPSDIEAPSIDYITFSSRKDGKSILVQDIDDVLFSEIMRDVDLAVSVAYVGGVDPVTSFSTMELRKAIIEYTCQLMKIDNVEISDHFANIQGVLNDYSVHLGSGHIYQKGGPALHVVPVYSGKRGKLYLPFIDEDPMSAQILSKVVMLAEDNKIKDPAILEQIVSIK